MSLSFVLSLTDTGIRTRHCVFALKLARYYSVSTFKSVDIIIVVCRITRMSNFRLRIPDYR